MFNWLALKLNNNSSLPNDYLPEDHAEGNIQSVHTTSKILHKDNTLFWVIPLFCDFKRISALRL